MLELTFEHKLAKKDFALIYTMNFNKNQLLTNLIIIAIPLRNKISYY